MSLLDESGIMQSFHCRLNGGAGGMSLGREAEVDPLLFLF